MSDFKRSFLGYRRSEVDAELAARDAAMAATERALATCRARGEELEAVATRLSEQVVQRDRELRAARAELAELRTEGEEGMRSLAALGRQLEEIRTQARGQATQIRLRALRDAAELVERVSEVARIPSAAGGRIIDALDEAMPGAEEASEGSKPAQPAEDPKPVGSAEDSVPAEHSPARGNGQAPAASNGLVDGTVNLDVGPLSDFSQLVRLEDAASSIGGAAEISIKRFSRGRATLSMRFSEPVELLRELEERCDLELRVRSQKDDSIVLDVDDEGE